MKLCLIVLYVSFAAPLLLQCDARRNVGHFKSSFRTRRGPTLQEDSAHGILRHIRPLKRLGVDPTVYQTAAAESPFSLPPFDDSYGYEAPLAMPQNSPPFCLNPPSIPSPTPITFPGSPAPPSSDMSAPPPPTTTIYPPGPPGLPNPPEYVPSPPGVVVGPPGDYGSTPPSVGPSPPETYVPGPPDSYGPTPPEGGYVPSPPGGGYVPSPPEGGYVPGPPEESEPPPAFVPGPPYFLPPVVFPPPAVPPPRRSGGGITLWCVAKPTVPDPIIQEAMNYACGSGADCQSIQPEGSCYQPDTLLSHASFAFNSYWQRTKAGGGTCDFGGTAMLITQDPSFDGCRFLYY
ncbi:hypothetical protein H6P81_019178 [Aristolochia fimbriata]|uniref:X8 domain-containing protein n=1 Tax=Aristolochia fimbriata TaxID=158543 RepID=A0AAV7DQZ8_ARIFI|nr:hypothetical protein H6P81_019178 [Aristolochia fimbriata]